MYYVYMIRCKDNSIYTGITTDLERRMTEHFTRSAKCAKYTLTHHASSLECVFSAKDRKTASRLEYAIKKLKKQDKEMIIRKRRLPSFMTEECWPEYENVDLGKMPFLDKYL